MIPSALLPPGLLQHPFRNPPDGTDRQRRQPDKQPLLWLDLQPAAFLILIIATFQLPSASDRLQFSARAGDLSKFGRGDASSPAPATTLAQTQQNQTQTHHTTQQPFLNPALPPGYSYTSLPYYTGMPGLPNTFQYGPAVFPVRARIFHQLVFVTSRFFIRISFSGVFFFVCNFNLSLFNCRI